MMCLSVAFIIFILLEIYWASWIFKFCFAVFVVTKFGDNLAITSSIFFFFCLIFSVLSFLDSNYISLPPVAIPVIANYN